MTNYETPQVERMMIGVALDLLAAARRYCGGSPLPSEFEAADVITKINVDVPAAFQVATAALVARQLAGRLNQTDRDTTVDEDQADDILAEARRGIMFGNPLGHLRDASLASDMVSLLGIALRRERAAMIAAAERLVDENDIMHLWRLLNHVCLLLHTIAGWSGPPHERLDALTFELLQRQLGDTINEEDQP